MARAPRTDRNAYQMASIGNDKNGHRRVLFVDTVGRLRNCLPYAHARGETVNMQTANLELLDTENSSGYIELMPRKPRKLSDQIRQALADSEHTRYRISQETGLNEAALGKFFHGERGLSLDSLDRLAEFLGLEVVIKRRKGR